MIAQSLLRILIRVVESLLYSTHAPNKKWLRNVPVKYDRELWQNSIHAMQVDTDGFDGFDNYHNPN